MDDATAPLAPTQLGAYFAFTEVSSLLRHAVEKQLRDAGGLSYVQFQLLARLGDAPDGRKRMTDLADGVVYSRSGLTYQAQLLEEHGLVTRTASPDDERSTVVTITNAGRDVLSAVFPGHIAALRSLLFDSLSDADTGELNRILGKAADHLRAIPPRSAAPRSAASRRKR
jgi:DNA-binding MarR family transcriptional regulator